MLEYFTPLMIKLFKYLMKQADYERSKAVISIHEPNRVRIDLNIFLKPGSFLTDFCALYDYSFDEVNSAYFSFTNKTKIFWHDHFYISSVGDTAEIYKLVPRRVIRKLHVEYNKRLSTLYYRETHVNKKRHDSEIFFFSWICTSRADTSTTNGNAVSVRDIPNVSVTPTRVYQFRVTDIKSAIKIFNGKYPGLSKNYLKKFIRKWVKLKLCQRQQDGTLVFTVSSSADDHAEYFKNLKFIYG